MRVIYGQGYLQHGTPHCAPGILRTNFYYKVRDFAYNEQTRIHVPSRLVFEAFLPSAKSFSDASTISNVISMKPRVWDSIKVVISDHYVVIS